MSLFESEISVKDLTGKILEGKCTPVCTSITSSVSSKKLAVPVPLLLLEFEISGWDGNMQLGQWEMTRNNQLCDDSVFEECVELWAGGSRVWEVPFQSMSSVEEVAQ